LAKKSTWQPKAVVQPEDEETKEVPVQKHIPDDLAA